MLEFRNLCAGYDGSDKIHGISAKLSPGTLTAVIGPNGCGKSTFLKCASGLLKPTGGEVLLNEKNLCSIAEKDRAKMISYMPQSRITPDISVAQLVAHGRYPHLKWGQNPGAADREIIESAIERVGLAENAGKLVSCLSGGERQRAYLAMMLAQEAPFMLLDEPTTYLDLSSQYTLMALLQHLRSDGRCICVVLHDLALALEYCDEILLMQNGELIARGSPETIYESKRIQNVFNVGVRRSEDHKYVFYAEGREATT